MAYKGLPIERVSKNVWKAIARVKNVENNDVLYKLNYGDTARNLNAINNMIQDGVLYYSKNRTNTVKLPEEQTVKSILLMNGLPSCPKKHQSSRPKKQQWCIV